MINIISDGEEHKETANHIVLEGILKFKGIKYLIIDLCLPGEGGVNTVDLKVLFIKIIIFVF